jgi:hypothetical protein
MRINSKAGVQHATFDGEFAGEGLTIFLSQNAGSNSRYRFQVSAITDQGTLQVGVLYSSPPNATVPTGPLTRAIATAVCPGAKGWAVDIVSANSSPEVDDTSNVILISSKCCTSPVGVTRIAERYVYVAGTVTTSFPVPAGKTVKSFAAIAGAIDGTVEIGPGDLINVPAGTSVQGTPGAAFIGVTQIAFTNVSYFVEFLESA